VAPSNLQQEKESSSAKNDQNSSLDSPENDSDHSREYNHQYLLVGAAPQKKLCLCADEYDQDYGLYTKSTRSAKLSVSASRPEKDRGGIFSPRGGVSVSACDYDMGMDEDSATVVL
jgi:hypothetical protein